MTKFTEEFIKAELEKAEKATARPWSEGLHGGSVINETLIGDLGELDFYGGEVICESACPEDQSLIISAVNIHEDALNEILRLRKALKLCGHSGSLSNEIKDSRI